MALFPKLVKHASPMHGSFAAIDRLGALIEPTPTPKKKGGPKGPRLKGPCGCGAPTRARDLVGTDARRVQCTACRRMWTMKIAADFERKKGRPRKDAVRVAPPPLPVPEPAPVAPPSATSPAETSESERSRKLPPETVVFEDDVMYDDGGAAGEPLGVELEGEFLERYREICKAPISDRVITYQPRNGSRT